MSHATKRTGRILILAMIALLLTTSCAFLISCNPRSSSSSTYDPNNNGGTIDSGSGLSEKEEATRDYYGGLISDSNYQSRYDGWIHDEGQLRQWMASGEQPAECMAAIDEWCFEIQNYSMEDIPEKYRSLHAELTGEAQRFRDEARMTLGY